MNLIMRDVLRWILTALAALVAGPIAYSITSAIPAPDGGPDATALVTSSIGVGVFATLGALAIAGVMGMVASRVGGVRWGLFAGGVVLAWATFGAGAVPGLMLTWRDEGIFIRLALEGALVGPLVVGLGYAIRRASYRRELHHESPAKLLSLDSALGMVIGVVAGGVAAWVIAREGLKGQAFGAAAIGALGACTAARAFRPRTLIEPVLAGVALLSVIGPLAALVIHGDGALAASNANRLFALGWITPLDWGAGMLFGAPIGLSWADSLTETRHEPAQVRRAGSPSS